MNFLGMGPLELLIVLGLALVVFGPGRLPEIARQLGRVLHEIRRVSSEVTGDLQRSIQVDSPQSNRPRVPYTPPTGGAATPSEPPSPEDVRPPY